MAEEIRILFGVDESDFSKKALAAIGALLSEDPGVRIEAFHGSPDPQPFLSRMPHLRAEDVEAHQKDWKRGAEKILDEGLEALRSAGLEPARASAFLQEQCKDPAEAMVKRAESESFDVVGLARWGANTMGRQVMGSITYRLACSSESLPVWIADPRIQSRDVLISLVGAPISRRVIDHVVRCFGHLRDSKFTLFHVIPPYLERGAGGKGFEEEGAEIADHVKAYVERVKEIAAEGKEKLIAAGIPEENVRLKVQTQDKGIARDLLAEMDAGDYGILAMGRKGSKALRQFGLGSKAYKLLCAGRSFLICLVN